VQKRRKPVDKHDWNTFENYQHIHNQRLAIHPIVDSSKGLPKFEFTQIGSELFVVLSGIIYCKYSIVLAVEKYYETRVLRDGRLQLRCFSYRYNGSIIGKHNIIRYDNNDDFEDYHKHIFSKDTGEQTERIQLTRATFPTLSDILDELQSIYEPGL
jgi:hypothetical protein